MNVMDAFQVLHMHKHQVRGVGKRPGLPERQPSWEEVGAWFEKALRAMSGGK
jgi:hypothetical protein